MSLPLAVLDSWIKMNTFKMNTFCHNNCIARKFATEVRKKSYHNTGYEKPHCLCTPKIFSPTES